MQGKAWANQYRTTVISVDSCEDRNPKGRLYNPYEPETAFQSTMDLLAKMEDQLDAMKFPVSYTAARKFSPPVERSPATDGIQPGNGKLATFAVRVLFRQNASWQGSVFWVEGGREEHFRSVLELLLLMDGALRESA
jgi:hypothetical protein